MVESLLVFGVAGRRRRHNGRMVEVEHIGEYQSYSPQPEDFYMVQTAEWAKGFALRKAEELIEWTKTHGLKREL